jgi:hypothetical protein
MKTMEVEVQLHALGECAALVPWNRPAILIGGEAGWVPEPGMEPVENRNISCPFLGSNPRRPARSPSLCRLQYLSLCKKK